MNNISTRNAENINNMLDEVKLIFYQKETLRYKRQFPFYDSGLTPLAIYYSRKYNAPLELPQNLQKIKGNTLYQITSSLYPKTFNIELAIAGNQDYAEEAELFRKDYIRNYFFFNKFYDFMVVFEGFKELYQLNQLDPLGELIWVSELFNVLMSFLVFRENPKLGFKLDTQNKSGDVYLYIKEITEKFIIEYTNKFNLNYILIFWVYQLLEPTSQIIEKEGFNLVSNLIELRKDKGLWELPNLFDEVYYFSSWIVYGVIKDYLNNNSTYFFENYKVDPNLIYETFENPRTLHSSKNKNKTENKTKNKTKGKTKNKTKSKTKNNKEDFKSIQKSKSKDDKDTSFWNIFIGFLLLSIILFVSGLCIIFFWSYIFSFAYNTIKN